MVIMEDESSSASDSADSPSPSSSVASSPAESPSSSPSSQTASHFNNCSSDSSVNSSSSKGSGEGGGGHCGGVNGVVNGGTNAPNLRGRGRRACTTPPPPSANSAPDKDLKSPPTPHKIQSLDEKSLRLDENYLAISPSTKTPVRRRIKLTDYFVQRRSNRKTQEAINAEKHQLLVKAIVEGKQDGLMAKRFNLKGRGVIATKPFLRHEFVVEYAGDLLTSVEARARENKYAKDSGAGCYMYYFQYNNQQYCVDATKESERFGRLVNHSRNGNLVTKVVEVKGSPRLILIAKRDIEVDEELCYDYGDRSREALRHHPWLAY